ncbi:hypothetical protein JDFR1000234_41 [uncultured archaeal virus]|uniref:Uncharacterized protein n=1 Tax=uncultured archaeal virus TaxID=1960247 RepID=A0A1S5Y325_9VIRU|nr:hypothetical protein JDFR1000234_41 [uncultured archaeal virus]
MFEKVKTIFEKIKGKPKVLGKKVKIVDVKIDSKESCVWVTIEYQNQKFQIILNYRYPTFTGEWFYESFEDIYKKLVELAREKIQDAETKESLFRKLQELKEQEIEV